MMIQVQKHFVLLCVILCTGRCSAAQKYGYEFIQDVNAWLRLHSVPATWHEARLRCHLEGGTLASPTSDGLASAMKSMMRNQAPSTKNMVYTGIQGVVAKGDYATIEGVPLADISLRWAAGEPDNRDNSEDCLTMNGAGELADVRCSSVFKYFCLKDNAKMNTTDCGTWDSDYQLDARTGSCYKIGLVGRSWRRAAEACRAAGAHLAVINSGAESQVLQELFAKYPPEMLPLAHRRIFAHIGFWDWGEHGEWLTIFGQTLAEAGFDTWAPHQPDSTLGREFCGSVTRGGLLNDFNCEVEAPYICEITRAQGKF